MKQLTATQQKQTSPGDRPRRAGPRPGFGLKAVLLFATAFVTGVFLWAPLPAVEQRLIAEVDQRTGLQLSIGASRLTPWLSLQLDDLQLQGEDLILSPLVIERLSISPTWSRLFSTDPAVSWRGQLWQGHLQGSVGKGGDWRFSGQDLHLNLPVWPEAGLVLTAMLSAAHLESAQPLKTDTASRLQLQLDQVRISGPGVPGDPRGLLLGQVSLRATGQGPALNISELRARDGVVNLVGQGSVLLAAEPLKSRANLTLSLMPTASAPADLVSLLELLGKPQSDGHFQLKVSGPLEQLALRP